jgi:hypothetical protein
MSGTITYPRPKSVTTNPTGVVLTIYAAEPPGAQAALTGAQGGTTGALQATWKGDADESAGTILKDHMRFVITPTIDPVALTVTYTIVATPVHGNGQVGVAKTLFVVHDDTIDQWQIDAGRARQP